jgi:DHA1 family bicyclomycin/chloramphenicol resistance-like MFS transporter
MNYLLKRESAWIPAILTLLLIGCWCELDLYAPSFPQMMHFYETTEQMMQLTLSLNFLGFFLASLLCGPLADAFGRRWVILGGTVLFTLGSAVCVFASSIELMLLGRLIQGLGVSAPVTVCMAVVADIYRGEKQMRLMSRMNSVMTVAMALAPVAGVYLTKHLGWQSNFLVILGVAVMGMVLIWLFLPETLPLENRRDFNTKSLINGYVTLLKSREFMFSTISCCFSITPYFVLIGIMPLLFMERLGVSLNQYAFYQGAVVGWFSILSLSVPALMSRFETKLLVWGSVVMSVLGVSLALIVSAIFPDNVNVITGCMLVYTTGIVFAPTFMFTSAMQMHPELKASASSMIQAIRMLSMAIGTAIAGYVYNGTFFPVAVVLFLFMVLSVPLTYAIMRRRVTSTTAHEPVMAMH